MATNEGSLPDSTPFEDLVAQALEALDDGGSAAVERVLRDHPGRSKAVRKALRRLGYSGLLIAEKKEFPDRLGEFRLLRRLGGGGMGVVFLALQESLDREVAVKLVRPEYLYFANARKRFRREVQAVSRLRHPGIVPVWHVGEDQNLPYFAMEYIPGCSLGEVLDEIRNRRGSEGRFVDLRGESLREAIRSVSSVGAENKIGSGSSGREHDSDSSALSELRTSRSGERLFAGSYERTCLRITLLVAEAMCHAHEQRIVHRDLKPSNVMVTSDGQVCLVDFGLAFLECDEKLTKSNALLGSLNYMSPEQVSQDEIDERADVYSLGATLYEMLSLEVPHGGMEPAAIRENILQGNITPLRRLNPTITRDTETVCEKAMATRPDHRYQTMLALVEDLRNLLELRPIRARPPSVVRRTTRWVQRHELLSLALVLLAVLVVASTALWWQQRAANQRLLEANTRANERLRASLVANARAERRSDTAGRRELGLDLLRQAAAIAPGPELRDDAITTLTLPDLVKAARWKLEHGSPIAVDDRFEHLIVAHANGRIDLVSPMDGTLITRLSENGGRATGAVFSQDATRLWISRAKPRNAPSARLELWNVAASPPVRLRHRDVPHGSVTLSHDEQLLGLSRRDGTVQWMDAHSLEVRHAETFEAEIGRCAFHPDDHMIAVPTMTGNCVVVFDVVDGSRLATLELTATVSSVDWSDDGKLLIAGCYDQRAYLYETSSWKQSTVLRGHGGELVRVALLPGRLAASHAWDRSTRIWDVEDGSDLLRCDAALIDIDRSGRRLLLMAHRVIEVAELISGDVLRVLHAHQGKAPREVASSPDGRLLATCGEAGWLLWDARTHEKLIKSPLEMVHSVAFEPSGDAVLTSGVDGFLRWPLSSKTLPVKTLPVKTLPTKTPSTKTPPTEVGEPVTLVEGACERSAVSPDGRWLAVVRPPEALLLSLPLDKSTSPRVLGRHRGLDRVAFSPDGAWVAVGSWGGDGLRVWATETGELLTHVFPGELSAMATFSPDSTRLTAATFEQVTVYRTGDWSVERSFRREGPRYPSLPPAFSPDGAVMAMGIAAERVRLVATEDWSTIADLHPARPHNLFHMCFLNKGKRLAIATPDHRLLIWELETLWAELARRDLIDLAKLPPGIHEKK